MFNRRVGIIAAIALACFAVPAHAQSLRIAAAADLQPVLPAVVSTFERQTGIDVQVSYQSSATLATQLVNGAPFDLFLAADLSFPQRVIDAGRAEEAHPVPYARGTLVLWTRNDSGIASLSLDSLKNPAVRKIAVADASHAPYGRAAQQALDKTGLLETLRSKLVIAENIAQAAQFVESGNAQAGFISLTSAVTPRLQAEGHFIEVSREDYAPLIQGAVVVKGAANAAHRFLDFLSTPAARQQLASDGLGAPR